VGELGSTIHADNSRVLRRAAVQPRVYLDEADNAPPAATRLDTHRSTVLQRVARATELLGYHPGERRLALGF
jgi:hypothetical protein